MPLYEYRCDKCQKTMTQLRRIAERHDPLPCRECGGGTRLLPSTFSISTRHEHAPDVAAETSSDSARGSRAGGMSLRNVHIENSNVGISIPRGANIDMDGVTFKNVRTPVEVREDN